MNSQLLIMGIISIIAVVAAFIGGILYAVKLFNDTISRD